MEILTRRLLLRPVRPADRDDLHRLEQDPEVMRYLNGGLPTPLEPVDPDASPYLMPRGRELEVRAVVARDGGAFMGWVAMFVDHDTGELGYRFIRTCWGQGFAAEAGQALIDDAFARLDIARIKAVTMAVNTRSRRVMEKLGLQHARTFTPTFADPVPGAEQGDVEYVLERHDWRRGRP
jgi:RimJ/RimL family protein N-acetyltransferase